MDNTMRFSHLFIFQLRPWSLDLGPPDLGSKSDLFDLLIYNFLIFYFLFQHLHPSAF